MVTRLVAQNARRRELAAAVERNEVAARDALAQAMEWERAADVLRAFSDDASSRLREDIERLVTHGLRSVFQDPSLEFHIHTSLKRGTTSVEFSLSAGGVEMPVPGAHGGGVLQVVSFVLRVVVMMLTPSARRILILDEPFSHVSANFRPRLATFLREIVDATGLQLLLVTHDDATPEVADVHVVLERRGGRTVARLVERNGDTSVSDP